LLRLEAQDLSAQLNKATRRAQKLDTQTRAHLQDSADTLNQALSAKLQRAAT
jgi:hypothetical protein